MSLARIGRLCENSCKGLCKDLCTCTLPPRRILGKPYLLVCTGSLGTLDLIYVSLRTNLTVALWDAKRRSLADNVQCLGYADISRREYAQIRAKFGDEWYRHHWYRTGGRFEDWVRSLALIPYPKVRALNSVNKTKPQV